MEIRTALVTLTLAALVPAAALAGGRPAVASDAPGTIWVRPVAGRVVRPFVAPRSRYGAGHRGADLAAAPGTPVVAPGDGRVVFAGPVAGSLHVVVAHAHGLRTSLSFLATVAVRAGMVVTRGQVVGTAGGSGPDHTAGVLHLGLRVGDEYVDPMRLFTPVDLATVVRLAPVGRRPRPPGYATSALEARGLAESLHLPRGIPGLEPPPAPSLWEQATGLLGDVWTGASDIAGATLAPDLIVWRTILAHTPLGAAADDVRTIASRLAAAWRARPDCTAESAAGAGGGGSGHLLFAVAGIDSSTDRRTGAAFGLDTAALGYRPDEIGWFSYGADGGAYSASDTWGDLVVAGYRLRDQLRAFARAHPGREVDLVAHSQGGIVADVFLHLVFDPGDPTLPPLGTVVTLSSPHRGAPLATVAAEVRATAAGRVFLATAERLAGGRLPPTGGTSTRQLAEGSALLERVWSRPSPDQVDETTIGATDDLVVPDGQSSAPGARAVTVDPAGLNDHSTVVADPEAMTAARLALEKRAPACVGLVDAVRGAIEPVVIRRVELTLGHELARGLDRVPAP